MAIRRSRENRSSAGGAAASGGDQFQRNVATWLATYILAEADASLPWQLPPTTRLKSMWCQAPAAMDDIVVETSERGFVFVQCRRTIRLGNTSTSTIATAIDQAVRQYIDSATAVPPVPWARELSVAKDRLVVISGSGSSASVRRSIPSVLAKARRLAPQDSLTAAAANADERRALGVISGHISHSWTHHAGVLPPNGTLLAILKLLHFYELDAEPGGAAERDGKSQLRQSVLLHSVQADAAWHAIGVECSRLASERALTGIEGLRTTLTSAGIQLRSGSDYHPDISQLRKTTAQSLTILRTQSAIPMRAGPIKLVRPVVDALLSAAENQSLVLTGDPGAGKSGVLAEVVDRLIGQGRDVVALLADRHGGDTLGGLRVNLGLSHDLVEVLTHWQGSEPGFLVIDALDAARGDAAARTLRQLIETTIQHPGRWRVIASIRKYDLRTSATLPQLFRGSPTPGFTDPLLPFIAHINVPLLAAHEIESACSQSALLREAIAQASVELRALLNNPFNLRLLAEIVDVAGVSADLSEVKTDLQLLDKYWAVRVIQDDNRGDGREAVLRIACEAMIAEQRLDVDRAVIASSASASDLSSLLSARVLTEWHPHGTPEPMRNVLLFAHHVLFDHAVARLLLRGRPDTVVTRLVNEPALVLMIQPSLRQHIRYVWCADPGRSSFWQLAIDIIRRSEVRETAKLLAPAVAAQLIRSYSDVAPLLTALTHSDAERREAAEICLAHLTRGVLSLDDPQAVLLGAMSPWPRIAEELSGIESRRNAYTLRTLLVAMTEGAPR
jgi:hypothetical protein